MAEWWDALMTIEKILYCIAVPSTIIFVIQTLFIIFGGHGDGFDASDSSGIDFDHDMSGMHGAGFDHDLSGMHGADINHNIEIGHNADIDYSQVTAHDGSTAHDTVDNLDSFRLFTIQGIIGFFCMFSWASIAGIANGMNAGLAIMTGFVLGIILMFAVAVIIRYSYRLAQDGTFNIKDTLGINATVYLTIPAKKSGQGKVNVMVSERMVELNAVTDSEDMINTGETVRIIDIINDFVVVERG